MERKTPRRQSIADIAAAKKETRRLIKERVGALTAEQMAEMSEIICIRLCELMEEAWLRRVAIFAARSGEVDLLPLLEIMPRAEWYFPLVHQGRKLTFHRVRSQDDLVIGAYGIREPKPDLPKAYPNCLDMIVLPGAAFTDEGDRLGYGGGFYDTLLAKLKPSVLCAGVCFSCQLLDSVPLAHHDRPVDMVITPDTPCFAW